MSAGCEGLIGRALKMKAVGMQETLPAIFGEKFSEGSLYHLANLLERFRLESNGCRT